MPLTADDIARVHRERSEAALQNTIFNRYHRAFPHHPLPIMYWPDHSPEGNARLERLMEQAIKNGKPLTPASMAKAEGQELPPPGAVV